MRRALLPSLFGFVHVLAACEPLATPEYRGEELGHLAGTITSELSSTPEGAEMVLLWINWRTAPGTVLGTRSKVHGTFPLGFRLSLFVPPPDDGLNAIPQRNPEIKESPLGIAWIVVLRAGATPPGGSIITHADVKGLQQGDVLGWAEDYVLAWIDDAPPEGSHVAEILSGVDARGFQLMRANGRTTEDLEQIRICKEMGGTRVMCAPQLDGLVPAENGMETMIPLRLTPNLDELRVPVFALPSAVEEAFGVAGG